MDFSAVHGCFAAIDVDRRAAGPGVAFRQVAGVDGQLAAILHHEAAAVGSSVALDGALPCRARANILDASAIVGIHFVLQRQSTVQGYGGAEALQGVPVEVQRHIHSGRNRHIFPGIRHHHDLVAVLRVRLNVRHRVADG